MWIILGVVVHTFDPRTLWEAEAEAGESLRVWGQPDLQSEFQDRQSCVEALFQTILPHTKKKNFKLWHMKST